MSRTSVSSSVARALMASIVIIGVAVNTGKAQGAPMADDQVLFKLENDWTQAVVKRDAAIMHRLTARRWVYTDESGVMEREAGIKAFTTGTDTVREASNERMRALLYDNSAVVIGVLVMKGRGPKGAFTNRYRYTDTWVKMEGRWQCVASQDYLMPAGKR